ncbi:MAG: branched-chain amino acid ABC transporter permease [Pseudomonadota bacterium]
MYIRKERIDRGIKARTEDIFALSSGWDMLYLLAPRLVPILFLIILTFTVSLYWQKVLISAAIFALLALSWDLLACTGMVSLGQALFFGMGAYLTGILNHYFHWPLYLTLPVSALGGGLISTFLLLPVLRLRGIYFSMITLVLPLMLVRIIEATRIFGGTEGISGLTPFGNRWVELYLSLGAAWAVLFALRRLHSSDYGLILRGISDNDQSVMSAGINIYWYKAQALFLAGSIGAFAGAFMSHSYMFVGMPVFALDYSILPIAAAVVGGMGTFAGPMLGAFILVPLSELLRGLGGLRIVIYALSLTIFIVALPEGIFHYIQRKYQQFERRVKVDMDS